MIKICFLHVAVAKTFCKFLVFDFEVLSKYLYPWRRNFVNLFRKMTRVEEYTIWYGKSLYEDATREADFLLKYYTLQNIKNNNNKNIQHYNAFGNCQISSSKKPLFGKTHRYSVFYISPFIYSKECQTSRCFYWWKLTTIAYSL